MSINHTAECNARQVIVQAWKAANPKHCVACDGSGMAGDGSMDYDTGFIDLGPRFTVVSPRKTIRVQVADIAEAYWRYVPLSPAFRVGAFDSMSVLTATGRSRPRNFRIPIMVRRVMCRSETTFFIKF